nr:hypothetical protein CFP56_13439 [Quercus suber]
MSCRAGSMARRSERFDGSVELPPGLADNGRAPGAQAARERVMTGQWRRWVATAACDAAALLARACVSSVAWALGGSLEGRDGSSSIEEFVDADEWKGGGGGEQVKWCWSGPTCRALRGVEHGRRFSRRAVNSRGQHHGHSRAAASLCSSTPTDASDPRVKIAAGAEAEMKRKGGHGVNSSALAEPDQSTKRVADGKGLHRLAGHSSRPRSLQTHILLHVSDDAAVCAQSVANQTTLSERPWLLPSWNVALHCHRHPHDHRRHPSPPSSRDRNPFHDAGRRSVPDDRLRPAPARPPARSRAHAPPPACIRAVASLFGSHRQQSRRTSVRETHRACKSPRETLLFLEIHVQVVVRFLLYLPDVVFGKVDFDVISLLPILTGGFRRGHLDFHVKKYQWPGRQPAYQGDCSDSRISVMTCFDGDSIKVGKLCLTAWLDDCACAEVRRIVAVLPPTTVRARDGVMVRADERLSWQASFLSLTSMFSSRFTLLAFCLSTRAFFKIRGAVTAPSGTYQALVATEFAPAPVSYDGESSGYLCPREAVWRYNYHLLHDQLRRHDQVNPSETRLGKSDIWLREIPATVTPRRQRNGFRRTQEGAEGRVLLGRQSLSRSLRLSFLFLLVGREEAKICDIRATVAGHIVLAGAYMDFNTILL